MKQLNSKKTRFPRFDKILVIQPIAEVYGEGNERQLCSEISVFCLIRFTTLRIPEVEESNHHSIWNRLPSSNCRSLLFSEGDKSKVLKGLLTVKTYPDQNVPKSKHNHWNLEWKSKCTHDFCSFLSSIFVNYSYKLCFQS